MTRGKNFVEFDVFAEILAGVPRKLGGEYKDVRGVYGDMSRLVVAWLANTPPKELAALSNQFGWVGRCNPRAVHRAAKRWMKVYHPERTTS